MNGPAAADFEVWVDSLRSGDPERPGEREGFAVGAVDFFREVFDANGGSVPIVLLKAAWQQRELELAKHAAALVAADLHRTTQARPHIEVRIVDGELIAVTYNGNYQTPALFAIRAPESICEVADNMRDHIMDDLWTVWPTCATHGSVLDPEPIGGAAVWYCKSKRHAVGRIGELPA